MPQAQVADGRLQRCRGDITTGSTLLDKSGRHAGVSLYGPAKIAVTDAQGSRLEECEFLYERKPKQ